MQLNVCIVGVIKFIVEFFNTSLDVLEVDQETSDSRTTSSVDASETLASNVDGVVFEDSVNMWIPDPSIEGMCRCPLPPAIPEEASPWVFRRQTNAEFIKDRSNVCCDDFPEKNMTMGDPCYPKQIGECECGLSWMTASLLFLCWFKLRTSAGAVARRRYVAVCKCKRHLHWDSSTEYIHSISYDEGGMSIHSQ
jgi:hypothetical protein